MDGTITCYLEDDSEPVVGRFRVLRVDFVTALNEGFEPAEVLYEGAGDCLPLAGFFAHSVGLIAKELREPVPPVPHLLSMMLPTMVGYASKLLILERIAIAPQYVGHRLGITTARRLIDMFADETTLVVTNPGWALRNDWYRSDTDPKPDAKAVRELERHWSRLGFRWLPATDLWIASTSGIPTVEQLADQRHKKGRNLVA
jgi:hypothetical protein